MGATGPLLCFFLGRLEWKLCPLFYTPVLSAVILWRNENAEGKTEIILTCVDLM